MAKNNLTKIAAEPGERDIVITRILDASREKLWKAWTDPEHEKRWWGPKDFTAPHISIDFLVGGKFVYCMRGAGPDGVVIFLEYW
jgi:uncharacterized protein YndB with AHSA1/START domain